MGEEVPVRREERLERLIIDSRIILSEGMWSNQIELERKECSCRQRQVEDRVNRRDVTVSGVTQLSFRLDNMNSLYTLGVRQTSSIQEDLEKMRSGDLSTSLQGIWIVINTFIQFLIRPHHPRTDYGFSICSEQNCRQS